MARPLRLEFPGAVYHIISRGNRRQAIYLCDADFEAFLECLSEVCSRFNWIVYAYCLMSNHYHLLAETPDANLSRGMRQLNGTYTQTFNRTHHKVGHLFQGRYQAIVVQKENYLLELTRYIVLNPVKAKMVAAAGDWPWSSYRATTGDSKPPVWLAADDLLRHFGNTKPNARRAFSQFVADGTNADNPLEATRYQLILGDDAFAEQLTGTGQDATGHPEVTRSQRQALVQPLAYYAGQESNRHHAMARAYLSGGYTMKEIAEYFGVHYVTVSRAVKKAENRPYRGRSAVSDCKT